VILFPFDGSAICFGNARHHPHLNVRSGSAREGMAEHVADYMAYTINNLTLQLPSSAGARQYDDVDGESDLNVSSNSLEFAHKLTFPQQVNIRQWLTLGFDAVSATYWGNLNSHGCLSLSISLSSLWRFCPMRNFMI
jgi:hypothetical protein